MASLGEVVGLLTAFRLAFEGPAVLPPVVRPLSPPRATRAPVPASDNPPMRDFAPAACRVLRTSPIGATTVSLAHCFMPSPGRLGRAGVSSWRVNGFLQGVER